jgi:magnesium-transporting ATPase (P-type)
MNDWHTLNSAEVLSRLGVDPAHGLSESEATTRLTAHALNELTERGIKSPWLIVWEQLTATRVMILVIAVAISVALGDYKDAAAIALIVALNALLGFRQEYRAEKAMAALKRLAVPTVKVRRGGHVQEVSARELIPGDIILLEAGNLVPAEVPFDSERKRMTTLHEIKASSRRADLSELICRAASVTGETCRVAFTKGAVDSLLDVSNSILALADDVVYYIDRIADGACAHHPL